jgi:hypothetical protein
MLNKEAAMKKALFFTGLMVFIINIAFAETGVKQRRPLPYEFGRVIINNYSETTHLSPVVFDHWLHRAKFTCRVCHIDIGFAMTANGTKMTAAIRRERTLNQNTNFKNSLQGGPKNGLAMELIGKKQRTKGK